MRLASLATRYDLSYLVCLRRNNEACNVQVIEQKFIDTFIIAAKEEIAVSLFPRVN